MLCHGLLVRARCRYDIGDFGVHPCFVSLFALSKGGGGGNTIQIIHVRKNSYG